MGNHVQLPQLWAAKLVGVHAGDVDSLLRQVFHPSDSKPPPPRHGHALLTPRPECFRGARECCLSLLPSPAPARARPARATLRPPTTTTASCQASRVTLQRRRRRSVQSADTLFTATVDLDECIARLYKKELLADSVIEAICAKAKELLMKESNVVHIDAPVTVVGDIHGQFFDMIEIFRIGGFCPDTNYLFLGACSATGPRF